MGDEQPVREEQRARRLREEAHRQLARAPDPFMRQVGVEEIREVGGRDARGEAVAVVGQRLVMIAGDDADSPGDGRMSSKTRSRSSSPWPSSSKRSPSKMSCGGRPYPPLPLDSGQRRFQREQVAMQVADDPRAAPRIALRRPGSPDPAPLPGARRKAAPAPAARSSSISKASTVARIRARTRGGDTASPDGGPVEVAHILHRRDATGSRAPVPPHRQRPRLTERRQAIANRRPARIRPAPAALREARPSAGAHDSGSLATSSPRCRPRSDRRR